jgi:hypothetical protein
MRFKRATTFSKGKKYLNTAFWKSKDKFEAIYKEHEKNVRKVLLVLKTVDQVLFRLSELTSPDFLTDQIIRNESLLKLSTYMIMNEKYKYVDDDVQLKKNKRLFFEIALSKFDNFVSIWDIDFNNEYIKENELDRETVEDLKLLILSTIKMLTDLSMIMQFKSDSFTRFCEFM